MKVGGADMQESISHMSFRLFVCLSLKPSQFLSTATAGYTCAPPKTHLPRVFKTDTLIPNVMTFIDLARQLQVKENEWEGVEPRKRSFLHVLDAIYTHMISPKL